MCVASFGKIGPPQLDLPVQLTAGTSLLILEEISHASREAGLHALGRAEAGRLLRISFTLRCGGKLIRVISARAVHRKERLRYDQEA